MASSPPPERYFKRAQTKIRKGHYEFRADAVALKQKEAEQ